jgi:hypothetical protein
MPRLTAENRKSWILATMTGSLSMITIAETVVSVALPTLDKLEYASLVPGYVMAGLGLATVMTPASTGATNTAPAAPRGQASGGCRRCAKLEGRSGWRSSALPWRVCSTIG